MSSRPDSVNGHCSREQMFQEDFVSITPEIREIFVQPHSLQQHYDSNQRMHRDRTRAQHNNYSLHHKSYLI